MDIRARWRPAVVALALFTAGLAWPGAGASSATARADQLTAASAAFCLAERSGAGAPCVQTDPGLVDALETLSRIEGGRELLATAGASGVTVVRGALSQDLYGRYLTGARTVVVNASLDGADVRERAAVLAHELQHAADHATGRLTPAESCLDQETSAYARMGRVWHEMWGESLPPARTTLSAALNTLSRWAAQGDDEVRRQLASLQMEMCGVG